MLAVPGIPENSTSAEKADLHQHAGQRKVFEPDPLWWDFEKAPLLHFPQSLFSHYYTMFWFGSDRKVLKSYSRLIRDHLHLRPEILAAANRIIPALGNYSCAHVRRTDFSFQYEKEYLNASTVADHVLTITEPQEFVYVASDERDRQYYEELKSAMQGRSIHLGDVKHLLPSNTPLFWYPHIEKMICVKARLFIGTRLSTFSGYITRLRGYSDDVENKVAYYTDQRYNRPIPDREVWPQDTYSWSAAWRGAIWGREFPESWANLDDLPSP